MTHLRSQALTVLLVCVKSLSFLSYMTYLTLSCKMKRMEYYYGWIDISKWKKDQESMLYTWTASISHRSPTSKGCITNKKIIDSNMVLHVFPNTNATTTTWELMKSKNLLVAIPKITRQMTRMMMLTKTFTIWWSLFTAVFVSFSVKARALRSLNAFTYKN